MIAPTDRRRIHSLVRVMTLAMGIALTATIPAAAHAPDPAISTSLYTQDEVLEFRWRAGSEPPTALKTAIREAADDINATRASRAARFAYAADGASPIGYGTGTCSAAGIACFTRDAPDDFTMWLREQGRPYDWGTLKWCQLYTTAPNGCYDAETIALDEFGHVEGLGHHANYVDDSDYRDAVVQTVSRTKPKSGWNMHVLGPCDTARLQIQYDITTASAAYSSCLDAATVLSLQRSASSVPFGGTVTMTASLRVATSTAYGRLSANPVSRRVVRLQRRAPGASTWATVATMAATSPTGSYITSLPLQATSDFRAVFSTPASEGLRGDTSPTLRVSVGPCTHAPCPQ